MTKPSQKDHKLVFRSKIFTTHYYFMKVIKHSSENIIYIWCIKK